MKTFVCHLGLAIALLLGTSSATYGQINVPYIEGPVWEVQMVKAKYGLEDDYFNNLRTTLKSGLDEAKKKKVILDYKILFGEAASPQD